MVFFSDAKFVSHYTPPLAYKKTKKALAYTLAIREETCINQHQEQNHYTQELMVRLEGKGFNGIYYFDVQTSHQTFTPDRALAPQSKLLEVLIPITQHLKLTVSENGTIKAVNHKAVVKQWEGLKAQRLKAYKGAPAHTFITGVAGRIQNEALFLEMLKEIQLFGLLFGGYQTLSEHDKPRLRKISNSIKFLPIPFEERVVAVKEDAEKQHRHITLRGSIKEVPEQTQTDIQTYFEGLAIENTTALVSNYHQEVVLDVQTGYPTAVVFEMKLSGGSGFTRKKHIHLKLQDHG